MDHSASTTRKQKLEKKVFIERGITFQPQRFRSNSGSARRQEGSVRYVEDRGIDKGKGKKG